MRAPAISLKRPGATTRRLRDAVRPSPRLRRRMLVAAVLAVLLGALYTLWLRDSSLVAVEQVSISGVTTRDSERLRSALASTARTMTTLHVDRERLEEAAAAFPVVAAIEVEADFPHRLALRVIEHRAAAMLESGGATVPVAGDGTILAGLPVEGDLPTIALSGPRPQRRIPPGAARDAAVVAGGAPPVISRRLDSIGREGGTRGVVVQVEGGPELIFGDTGRVRAKWAAVVRVLADSEASGATYIDVRIPERPVAGGLSVETVAPAAPLAESAVSPAGPAAVEPVAPPIDPGLAAPEEPAAEPSPDVAVPVAPAAPEGAGGLVP